MFPRHGAAAIVCFAALAFWCAQQARTQQASEPQAIGPPEVVRLTGAPPAPSEPVVGDSPVSISAAVENVAGQADQVVQGQQPNPLVEAYAAAMNSKLEHYLDFFSRNDTKSATRLTQELTMLVNMAATLGDNEEWRQATSRVGQAVNTLEEEGLAGLDTVRSRIRDMATVSPTGALQPPPRTPRELTGFMHSLDGILSDAKQLTEANDLVGARRHTAVLSDLGRQLSTARQVDYWVPRAEGLIDATSAATQSTTTDVDEFSKLLRTIRIRCDECHDESS